LGNKVDLAEDHDHLSTNCPRFYADTEIEILYISALTTEHWSEFKELLKQTCRKAYPNAITRYRYTQDRSTQENGEKNSIRIVHGSRESAYEQRECWC